MPKDGAIRAGTCPLCAVEGRGSVRPMKRLIPVALAAVALLACQQTTPTGPPNVAGTYTGTLTMTVPSRGDRSFDAVVDVAQSGNDLDISMVISSSEVSSSSRASGKISNAGEFIYGRGRRPSAFPDCGYITRSTGSMKFSGKTLRWTATAETENCGAITADATLTRS